MRVKDLRKFLELEEVSDDAIVVIPQSDHQYARANAHKTTAASYSGWNQLAEDYGEMNPDEDEGRPPDIIEVLLIE